MNSLDEEQDRLELRLGDGRVGRLDQDDVLQQGRSLRAGFFAGQGGCRRLSWLTASCLALLSWAHSSPSHAAGLIQVVRASALAGWVQATGSVASTDKTRPTLVVTTPSAGASSLSTVSPCLVTGAASDVGGIDRVEVALNGAAPVRASLGKGGAPTSCPWSVLITPVEGGSNTLAVTAYDLHGNASTTVTRTFAYTRRYLVTVKRTIPAGATRAGQVILTATPPTAATVLTPVTTTASSRSSQVLPGKLVKLKALPLTGYVFSHWAVKPAGATVLGNVLSFTMPVQDVSVEAVFMANPFLSATGQGNGFYGLLEPYGSTATGNSTVGWFTGTIVPTTGGFSGRLVIGGVTTPVLGTFFGDGRILYHPDVSTQGTIRVGTREVLLTYGADGISVELSEGASKVVGGLARRACYSSVNQVPESLMNRKMTATAVTNDQGFLTLALAPKAQTPARNLTSYPQGDGQSAVTIGETGLVMTTGVLADGTSFLSSSAMVASNQFAFYTPLQTPGETSQVKGGSFSGWMVFDKSQPGSDITGTNLLWIRPAVTQLTGASAAARASQLYTDGWPAGLRLDAVGAYYDRTMDAQKSLVLGPVNRKTGNGELYFSGSKLKAGLSVKAFNVLPGALTGTSMVSKTSLLNDTFSLSVIQRTGVFSGSFRPNWTSASPVKPQFRGVLIQKGASKGGYGHFISNRVNDLDPETGRVTLGAPVAR